MMTLYGYWRSSASYRVRLACGLKGIAVKHSPVNLKDGEQLSGAHQQRNPQKLVPVLELEDGTKLTQSLAIIEYLEEIAPSPALLPDNPVIKAKVRAASQAITADIAPIQNLRVLKYIRAEHGQDDTGVKNWAAHWIASGFEAVEALVNESDKTFLHRSEPGYFECCLIPQIYNARRFGVDMGRFPALSAIDERLKPHPVFNAALPENQPDAP